MILSTATTKPIIKELLRNLNEIVFEEGQPPPAGHLRAEMMLEYVTCLEKLLGMTESGTYHDGKVKVQPTIVNGPVPWGK